MKTQTISKLNEMRLTAMAESYIACALGNAACRNFHTVKYIRLPELLDELAVARGEGIFKKVIKQYKNVNLLILDELCKALHNSSTTTI